VRRYREAYGARFASGEVLAYLLGREMTAGARVAGRKLGGDLLLAHYFELFGSTEATIGLSSVQKDIGVFAIDFSALGLSIGPERATNVGAFVPAQSKPAKRIEDHLLGGGDEACAVRVLDAEHKFAGTLTSVNVVKQADVSGAYMWITGRRRSDTDANCGFRASACHDGIKH
jgi:hypothetical protein